MYIEISEDFGGMVDDDLGKYLVCFENLIAAHANGWHVVVFPRELGLRLADDVRLSLRQRQILSSDINKRRSTRFGELAAIPLAIKAVVSTEPESYAEDRILLHLGRFADMQNCLASRLLVENFRYDGAFMRKIAEIAAIELGASVPLSFDLIHGGGGTMSAYYAAHFNDVRPLLCVVDSDKCHGEDELGETASAVLQIGQSNQFGTVQTAVLPCKETENIIPLSFLFEVYENDPGVRSHVSAFHGFKCSCEARGQSSSLLFLDFKVGQRAAELKRLPEDVRVVIADLVRAATGRALDDLDDRASAYYGVSSYLLSRTLSFLEEKPYKERVFREKLVAAPYWQILTPLARQLIGFGAGGRRLPI